MLTLKFTNTHNIVTFLSKPTESDGFEQIVDFLNAHPIRKPRRKDTQVPQPSGPPKFVTDEAVHKELDDSLVRAATIVSSIEAEQDSGNITKTQSKATPNEPSSYGTDSGGGPRCQETIGILLLKLVCTNLQNRVLDLEKTKSTQFNEIASLKRRVKKLKNRNRSRTHKLKKLYKVGLSAKLESSRDEESLGEDASKQERRMDTIDVDEDITLVSVQDDADKEMFDVDDLEVTLAHALKALKTSKPKVQGIVFQEPGKSTMKTSKTISLQQSQNNGKGIMIEEPVKPKKKDQIRLDEKAAKKLQAVFDEEERLA
nr:hypothetical protein [Tanacetum cinerariifolium]